MPRRSSVPQSPRHIMIYDDDWEYLMQQYGPTSEKRIGAGNAIRELVHRAVGHLRAAEQQLRDARASARAQQHMEAE